MSLRKKKRRPPVGASPGTLVIPKESPKPVIKLIDYGPVDLIERTITDVADIARYLDADTVTWVEVEGLGDEQLILEIGKIFNLHPLALADAVNLPQRPKTESYDTFQLIITRLARFNPAEVDVLTEQVSIFLGDHFVLTLQEECGDVFDPVRARIRAGAGPIRKSGPDYLAYSLLDTVVDGYYPVLEDMGEALDEIEQNILTNPEPEHLRSIYNGRRQLLELRRAIWPQREAMNSLIRDENDLISAHVRVYLRDVYDHIVQVIDVTETYRELATNLMDIYLSAVGQRTNEVMKVLTVVSSIFIPLTFIAGVYGMNFHYMPELAQRWGYPICIASMVVIAAGELFFFWKRGYLGGRKTAAAVIPRSTDRER
jgi:magnesium transporter